MKLLFLPVFFVVLCFAAEAQTAAPTPPGIDDVYLAKDDGNGHAGDAATNFISTDIPIYCVVQLDSNTPATVKMNLVAENVRGVKAETKIVSTSYTTKNGQSRVNFYGKPDGNWVPGKYRADIFIDGKLAKNLPFEITAPAKANVVSRSFQAPKKSKAVVTVKKKPFVPFTAQNFRH